MHRWLMLCLSLTTSAAGLISTCGYANAFPPRTFSGLYSSSSPADVLTVLPQDLAPGRDLVLSAAALSPSSFSGTGNCGAGSAYSAWSDTPTQVGGTKCDGTDGPATPQGASQNRFQRELRKIGALLITSIPGWTIDLRQDAVGLTVTQTSATESFECGSAAVRPYPPVKSVKVVDGARAKLTLCPSRDAVSIRPVNVRSQHYAKAFNSFRTDPVRNQPWGGDRYKYNLFTQCTAAPFTYAAEPALRLTRKGIAATFLSISTLDYCDEVGQYSSEVTAQARKHGTKHYHQVGGAALHIDGLQEILLYARSDVFYKRKDRVVHAIVPGTQALCSPGLKHYQLRLRLSEHFQGMKTQQFVHASDGTTTGFGGYAGVTKTFHTAPRTIC